MGAVVLHLNNPIQIKYAGLKLCSLDHENLSIIHNIVAKSINSTLVYRITNSDGRYQQFPVRYDVVFFTKISKYRYFRYFKINIDIA